MLKTAVLLNPVYVTLFWTIVFLLGLEKKNRTGRSLFVFMLTAFVLYLAHALYFSGYLLQYSYIDGVYLFCSLSVYPLFYYYVRHLATRSGVRPVHLLHLFIPAIFAIVQYSLYSGLDATARVEYLSSDVGPGSIASGRFYWLYLNSKLARYVFAAEVIVYVSLALGLIRKHQQQVEEMFSNEDTVWTGLGQNADPVHDPDGTDQFYPCP